jgi:hypothetical protein
VRDVGREVAADRLQPPKLRDIVEDEQQPDPPTLGVLERLARGLQRPRRAMAHGELLGKTARRGQGVGHEPVKLRLADHLLQQAAPSRPALQPQQILRGPVHAEYPLFGIDREHAVRHRLEDRLQLGLAGPQLGDVRLELSGHPVERLRHHLQLAAGGLDDPVIEVAGGEAERAAGQV